MFREVIWSADVIRSLSKNLKYLSLRASVFYDTHYIPVQRTPCTKNIVFLFYVLHYCYFMILVYFNKAYILGLK